MKDFDLRKYLDNNPLIREYGETEFDRSPEMYSGGKSEREGTKVSQWLIDSFIAGVEAQEQFGEKWDLYATEGEGYDKLMTAAEETILSTDSGDATEEELIDAAQSQYKELEENKPLKEDVNEVFDPEGDYDIQYEIEDYDRGDEVVVLSSLSHDPLNKQGETGVVFDVDKFEKFVIVKFDDGQIGEYPVGYVVFPGDENYVHPEEEEELDPDLFDPSTEIGGEVEDYYQSIKKGRKDWN